MNPIKICLIDDDKIYQFTTQKIIANANLAKDILIFSDGEEAYKFFENAKTKPESLPDVVFLDINMPYMDGWQFLEEYAKIEKEIMKPIRIYLVSSSVDEADTKRASENPLLSGYIFKPFTKEKLMQATSFLQS
ncbi:response regulator [Leptospira idonii]|uniref:Response regulator n=1 Tax=Leptospira idonii TaxID=1193500 RepID=A0A4V3JXY3_9LEPT|nr:response regulator [Leptospira idonii]TGN18866.1 response regulator [Leptospira idonii]